MSAGPSHLVQVLGQGLWQNGGGTEQDSIAVVEVMVESIDTALWQSLRERLERELAQDEINIRAQEIRRL
jgi:hypothetical protein